MSKTEPMLTCRKPELTSKSEACPISESSLQVYSECCASGVRHKVGMTQYQALFGNCGNQSS